MIVARSVWSLILHYDFQIRKEQANMILKGGDFAGALREAWSDQVLRERHFATPLAVPAISSAPRARSRSPRGRGSSSAGNFGKDQGGKGRGKSRKAGTGQGKNGMKGAGKGSNKDWHSRTPDGRAICYAYNNTNEKCKGSCGRVRVCRKCFGKRPVHMCKSSGAPPGD